MILVYDDLGDTWIWVDPKNHDTELSPQFDTKTAAKEWYAQLKQYFKEHR